MEMEIEGMNVASRRDETAREEPLSFKTKTLYGIVALITILMGLALFASSAPDGLSYVSENVYGLQGESFRLGLMDDYDFLGIGGPLGTIFSAIIGAIVIFIVFLVPIVIYRTIKKEKRQVK